MQVFHVLHLLVACLCYLLGKIVLWFLIQQQSDEVINAIECHSHSCHQVSSFRLLRHFSIINGGIDCIDMICLEALVQFSSSNIQSVRSGDVSAQCAWMQRLTENL